MRDQVSGCVAQKSDRARDLPLRNHCEYVSPAAPRVIDFWLKSHEPPGFTRDGVDASVERDAYPYGNILRKLRGTKLAK